MIASHTAFTCWFTHAAASGHPLQQLVVELLPPTINAVSESIAKQVCTAAIHQDRAQAITVGRRATEQGPVLGLGSVSYAESTVQVLDGQHITTDSATWLAGTRCVTTIFTATAAPIASFSSFLVVARDVAQRT